MGSEPISRKLLGIIEIDLVFENISGLLIRMPIHAQTFRIGGADQYPMVTIRKYRIESSEGGEKKGKEEIEKEVPLIPGSSIKGRMRGLLELALGKKLFSTDNKIWQHVRSIRAMASDINEFFKDIEDRCEIDDLFGWAAANLSQIAEKLGNNMEEALKYFRKLAPTRLLVDDFTPTEEFISQNLDEFESIADFIEEKSENRIDRVTSAADPRQIARIRPGIEFGGKMKVLVFDIDKGYIKRYLSTLALGLKLLEDTYIGASGSRGYGRIRFKKIGIKLHKVSKGKGAVGLESIELGTYNRVNDLTDEAITELAYKIDKELFGSPD